MFLLLLYPTYSSLIFMTTANRSENMKWEPRQMKRKDNIALRNDRKIDKKKGS